MKALCKRSVGQESSLKRRQLRLDRKVFPTSSFLIQIQKPSVIIIPAVYREWDDGWPDWTQGREIFLYQRTNASAPNFAPNYGLEGGVYLKYLVDHYDDLPDIMVFVHAK